MICTPQASKGFSAIGSDARLKVLRSLVRAGPSGLSVGEIRHRLDIPASTLAHHLRALADGGLIDQQKCGRTVINRANYDHIHELVNYLLEECCVDEPNTAAACLPNE